MEITENQIYEAFGLEAPENPTPAAENETEPEEQV